MGAYGVGFNQPVGRFAGVEVDGISLKNNSIILTFTDTTSFASFNVGDTVRQKGSGGAITGTIGEISTTYKRIGINPVSGIFTVGAQIEDISVAPTYPPAPTTYPPGTGYTMVVDVTGDTTNLTSYPLAGLTPVSRYYSQVQYNSATIPTSSGYSAWSAFTTA
jgi:hypothetical protein